MEVGLTMGFEPSLDRPQTGVRRMRNGKLVGTLLGVVLLHAAMGASALPHPKRATIEDGSGCPNNAVCGTIVRPLDPDHRIGGKISIAYRLYRHRGPGAAVGTI